MCDTLGSVGSFRCFAKNSDRSPNEVQVLEYYPAINHSEREVKLTYRSIPQVPRTHAVLLSRPTWLWGAEIGVNDCGVCIGNEAVFTKGEYNTEGLTGMDMLRLALERTETAAEARDCLISLLEQYGQGGNCGYDSTFYYDNAFLIMDRSALFVLETAGRQWAWKAYDRASISNHLSLGRNADCYSGGQLCDFNVLHTDPILTERFGGLFRHHQTACAAAQASTLHDMMQALRNHIDGVHPFAEGSVRSTCMHFGGDSNDHTTSSMVVDLQSDRTIVWSTGASTPCISLFKPWLFGTVPVAPVFAGGDQAAEQYWKTQENFRRQLVGRKIPTEYYLQRDALEQTWRTLADQTPNEAFAELSLRCYREEQEFLAQWKPATFERVTTTDLFIARWKQKNAALR